MAVRLNIDAIRMNIANLSFLVLFPGFFFYQFSISKGYIPPILGGYFGIVSVFILFPLLFLSRIKGLRWSQSRICLFFAILLLSLVIALFNYALGLPLELTKEMLMWSSAGILFNVICFLISSRMNVIFLAKIGYYLAFIMLGIVVLNIGEFGMLDLRSDAIADSDSVSSYQGLARSILMVLLISSGVHFDKGWRFYVLVIVGFILLFLNGARTEFALFLISIIFIHIIYSSFSFKRVVAILSLLLILAVVMFSMRELIMSSRMLQIVDLLNSSSGQERIKTITLGVELISDSPILGAYGGYITEGGIGYYPHNLLSAWVNLGLLGFLLYVFLFVALWKDAFIGLLKKEMSDEFKVFIMFLFAVSLALLVSKHYSYMLVGVLVGLNFQYKDSLRRSN